MYSIYVRIESGRGGEGVAGRNRGQSSLLVVDTTAKEEVERERSDDEKIKRSKSQLPKSGESVEARVAEAGNGEMDTVWLSLQCVGGLAMEKVWSCSVPIRSG